MVAAMSYADLDDDSGDVPVATEQASGERFLARAIAAEKATGYPEKTDEAAKRNIFVRIGLTALGAVVLLLGLAMLVLPGPGLLVIAAGLVLLAMEVPFAARLLERVRERLPQDDDGKLPKSAIVTMVLMFVVATGASIAWAVIK